MIDSFKQAESEFNRITDVQPKRLVYVGGDLYAQGKQCCEKMATLICGKGDVVITTGHLNSIGLELRRKGFKNCILEKYPGMNLIEIHENLEDANIARDWFKGIYKKL